jgi:hypothetical protein
MRSFRLNFFVLAPFHGVKCMLKSPRLALASVFAVVGLSAAPAQAVLTTFANFTGIDAATGIRFQNSAPDDISGTSGTLYTIDTLTSAPGSRLVSFSFLPPALAAVTNVLASFTMLSNTASPAQTAGGFTLQPGLAGAFSFLTASAISVGGTNYAAGANLLSGTFTDVSISGQTNASAAAYNGSTGGGSTILFTSDFVSFVPGSDFDMSISLTSLAPLLFANPGAALRSFQAYSTGSFSSDPEAIVVGGVPEPSVWAMLIAGFGLVGFQARRRRNAAQANAA